MEDNSKFVLGEVVVRLLESHEREHFEE